MDATVWARVREVFDHLADKSPSHRRDYLDMVCEGEPEIRVEIEALLEAHDGMDDEPPPWAWVTQTKTPTAIRSYAVTDTLGSGGMGTVYAATHPEYGDVALKLLPELTVADGTACQRFEREAQVLMDLEHISLCRVYECFVEEGWAVIAMERVDGMDLASTIEIGPQSRAFTLAVIESLLEVLVLAHSHGIVHRDLKPSNILVGSDCEVKLIDFGIAKFADTKLTATGQILGTPHYMSPEQWRGAGLDARADLWALGCLWYEMLSGRQAFNGQDMTAVAQAVLNDQPAPLPAVCRDGHSLEDVAPVIERLLQKEADARWPSARDLLDIVHQLRTPN